MSNRGTRPYALILALTCICGTTWCPAQPAQAKGLELAAQFPSQPSPLAFHGDP